LSVVRVLVDARDRRVGRRRGERRIQFNTNLTTNA